MHLAMQLAGVVCGRERDGSNISRVFIGTLFSNFETGLLTILTLLNFCVGFLTRFDWQIYADCKYSFCFRLKYIFGSLKPFCVTLGQKIIYRQTSSTANASTIYHTHIKKLLFILTIGNF